MDFQRCVAALKRKVKSFCVVGHPYKYRYVNMLCFLFHNIKATFFENEN